MDVEMSRPQRLKFWKEHLRLFAKFNGSQKRYCEENNLHPRNFSLYKMRISRAKLGRPKKAKAFSEVVVVAKGASKAIDFRELPDPTWLAKFLKEWTR